MPHSWGKLESIERWLEQHTAGSGTSGPARRSSEEHWVVEGRLQLAEGQMLFAGAQRAPGTSERIVAFRRSAARDGFEAALASRGASASQRSRAQAGLREIGRSHAALPAAAPAAVGGLIRRNAWNPRRADPRNMTRATAPWRWITVHHADYTPASSSLADSLDTVNRIQRFHIQNNGWADIGYHFMIDRAGRVIECRPLTWQGAHVGGDNNIGNVGICLLGNFDNEHPSRAALASLDRLVLELQRKLGIPRANVRPHKAWKETACPGTHLMPWFARR